MSYTIEGKDIVITGFEKGIADSPYAGIGDMRNIEIISTPGEAAVALGTTGVTKPPVFNATSFTATASNDTITVASTSGMYAGTAIVLNTNSAGGLSTGKVYYVQNLTSTTFTLSLGAGTTTAVNITADGSGTFTTYQFADSGPVAYFPDTTGALAGVNSVFVTDANGHVWTFFQSSIGTFPANTLVFMGNIAGVVTSGIPSISGITVWNGYLFLLGIVTAGTDIASVGNLLFDPASCWTYTWQNLDTRSTDGVNPTLVSKEDGNLYWCSSDGLGSLIETPGSSFNPSTPATYTLNNGDALLVPETDEATCIAELGQNILIGGLGSFVYVWNKIDPGFSDLLNVPDNFTKKIIATNQNAYIFAGTRGRIYITNGSGIDLYKKIPDYLTGLFNPFYVWGDASFGRNQLFFSFYVRNSAGTIQSLCSGAWAIDLDSEAMRMLNKTSDASYGGIVRMVTLRPSDNTGSPLSSVVGNNLAIGWYNGSNTSFIDVSTAVPYTNYESYMELDMIPVGTFLDRFTPTQIEWKTSMPLGGGGTLEKIRISYRENLLDAFTVIGETQATGTNVVGTTTGTTTGYAVSDYFSANFQNIQWVQLKVELASNSTTPTYNRLTEVRIRDWPSGKNNNT